MARSTGIGDRQVTRTHRANGLTGRVEPTPRGAARTGQAGWTLVELLVVISLIMILATIGLAQYRNSVTAAREAVLKEDLFRMREAIDQYYADKGEYPSSLDLLVSEGYLREIPVDPFTRSRDTWQTILAEPDPNNPTASIGIYDVKSGSDQTALNGTKYSEW